MTLRLPVWLGLCLALGSAFWSRPVLVAGTASRFQGSPERLQSRAHERPAASPQAAASRQSRAQERPPVAHGAALDRYCVTCHNERLKTGGLLLDQADRVNVGADAETWEKVVRRLRAGTMPPQGSPRPDRATYDALIGWLEPALDRAVADHPAPGRPLLHRVNRVEYANAVRDLLALDVDAASLLPPDDAGFGGFDNIADVLGVSPLLQERYLVAAQKISAAAVGAPELATPVDSNYQVPGDRTQTKHIEGLPLGTRGGVLIQHTFPVDGEYLIAPKLWKTNNWVIRGITPAQRARDHGRRPASPPGRRRRPAGTGQVSRRSHGPRQGLGSVARRHQRRIFERLQVRIPVKAGPHADRRRVRLPECRPGAAAAAAARIARRCRRRGGDAAGRLRHDQRPAAAGRRGRHAESPPDLRVPSGEPCRGRAVCAEDSDDAGAPCLSAARRRGRRQRLLRFYDSGRREQGDFDTGIQVALQRMLSDPKFIFRVEHDPPGAAPGTIHRISHLELASRLSFFLWSSIPDDELLNLASRARLRRPGGARAAGAPDAGRPARAGAGQQLRGAVAVCPEPARARTRIAWSSRTSTTTCGSRSSARPRCSSRASCARTATCWI